MLSKRGTQLRPTALLLLAAAVIAWLVTMDRMRGMDMGPGTDLGGLGWFAGVWAVMMAAMMLPSLVPMADTYAGQARAGSETGAPRSLMQTTLFVGGYLLAWVLVGLAAWTLVKEVRSFDVGFLGWGKGGRYVAGAVIAIASLAGAWIVAVAGFGGMRDHDGALSFTPRLPERLTRLAFGICFRERRLKVEVEADQARYSLLQGPALEITHHGQTITVTPPETVTCPIPKIAAGEPPRQPPGRGPAKRRAA